MDDNPSPERQLALDRRKSWLAELTAEPLFIRTIAINMAYFSRLLPRWKTLEATSAAYNPNIHLEPWQRQDLLVCNGLTRTLVSRVLKLGDLKIRNQIRYPNRLVCAVLSRFLEDKKSEITCVATLAGHSIRFTLLRSTQRRPFWQPAPTTKPQSCGAFHLTDR